MPHRFDPAHADRLLSPERRQSRIPTRSSTPSECFPGCAFADVGCGPGFFTLPAAERVGDEGRVYALDVQREMIARVEERAATAGLDNVKAMLSKEVELPLPGRRGRRRAARERPARVARPGEVPGRDRSDAPARSGVLGVVDWQKAEMPMGPPLADRLSPDQVEADLRAAGFEVEGTFDAGPRHYGIKARWRRSPNGRVATA